MTQVHEPKLVLNAGSGPNTPGRLHEGFPRETWAEVRFDIDPRTTPDLVGSISDMRDTIADESFDAIWSSHSIEHLHAHEVAPAFREFHRVLKSDGFALLTCPNLEPVFELALRKGLETVAYQSPAGPIRALDMLFGHGRSIEAGQLAMSHKTGFTADRLGRLAIETGFTEARVLEGANYDLWALLLMPNTNLLDFYRYFESTNIARLFSADLEPAYREKDAFQWSHVTA